MTKESSQNYHRTKTRLGHCQKQRNDILNIQREDVSLDDTKRERERERERKRERERECVGGREGELRIGIEEDNSLA